MNRLYFGDNLGWLRNTKEFPDASVDLVYLDPPFNSNADYGKPREAVIGKLIFVLMLGGPVFARTEQEDKALAYAEVAVKQGLSSPSSAQFCPPSEAQFFWKDGNICVLLWIDTKNVYGTPMRQHWAVALDPDTFEVKMKICKELQDALR